MGNLYYSFAVILSLFLFLSCGTESTPVYTLTTTVNGEGTISPSSGEFEDGDVVTLTSNSDEGWTFQSWSGDGSGSSTSVSITMDSDKNVVGNFQRRDYPLNISVEGEGSVDERIISQPKTTDYPYETVVELTPVPDEGWEFVEWGGDLSGDEGPIQITISEEKNVTVKFDSKVKTFGGSQNEDVRDIVQTDDGGYVLIGNTRSNDGDFNGMNKGQTDIYVMKLTSNGNIQWKHTFGGSEQDQGYSIIQTIDGDYILTGSTTSNDGDFSGMNNGSYDIFVMRLSSNGDIQWNKTYGGSNSDQGRSIIQATDGGYILTGITSSNDEDFIDMNKGSSDIFVLKLASNGDIQWNKNYGGSGSERGFSIIQTTDGGYILTGITSSNDGDFNGMYKGFFDTFVIKLSSNGDIQWNKTYGGSGNEYGNKIIQTTDGGYVLTGYTNSNDGDFNGVNYGRYDNIFVIKLTSNGDIQWINSYGGGSYDQGISIIQTTEGDYILTGYILSNDGDFSGMNKGQSDIFVMKLTSNGSIHWINTFGGSGNEYGNNITQTPNGGYILTGATDSNDGDFSGMNKGKNDIYFIRLDSNGEL